MQAAILQMHATYCEMIMVAMMLQNDMLLSILALPVSQMVESRKDRIGKEAMWEPSSLRWRCKGLTSCHRPAAQQRFVAA